MSLAFALIFTRSAMQFCLQPHLPKVAIVAAHNVADVMSSVFNAIFALVKDDVLIVGHESSVARAFTLISASGGAAVNAL
jgi:hypothetical protein